MDVNGEQIGSVEDLYLDAREEGLVRAVRFLDVSAGGFLGMGKKHFLVPVRRLVAGWARKTG
ncbi:MAG: PRC-barrel domain-containing protein [Actinomycetota bacterium]|nr:PRC-barrel domain-containing protein [Actinomycetota bacterium]